MQSGLLLDVVVGQSAAIFQLLASKDQPLLIWGDPLLVLDLRLDILNSVRGLDLEGDGLSSQGFDKDLHTTTETKDQMQSRLLLDVVVRKGTTILKLLAGEDQPLLVWWNTLLVLDFGLNIFNGVRGLNFKRDGFSSQGLDKNLHSTSETKDQVKC